MTGASGNLADLFTVVAQAVPDRDAVIDGRRRLTYAALDERANRLANVLSYNGIGPGQNVGLHLHNSVEYLEGMLAAFKLGAVPINVNYRYGVEELRQLFVDADLVGVVHEADFGAVLDQVQPDVDGLAFRLARGPEYDHALAEASPVPPSGPRSGDDHYILYTGGTTGTPKGVVWRHEDLYLSALGGDPTWLARPDDLAVRAVRGRTHLLPASPFMHGSAHWTALTALLSGGTVIVGPSPSFDPSRTLQLVADERVTLLVIVGDAYARPLCDVLDRNAGSWDLTSLTVVLSGGTLLSPSSKEALLERLPGCMVVDGFGASETGGQGQSVAVAGSNRSSTRFVMDDTNAVLDDDLQPVAAGSGVVGRLARRGRIPLGYYGDPQTSAATFPVIAGERWALPGDLATVEPDGTICVLGRGTSSINTGGEKVHPEEVEAVLKDHADVYDAVVVGLPDDHWGERVTAVVQPRPGTTTTTEALRAHVHARLADFKAPHDVVFVDRIERSPSGKPDRRWARQQAEPE